MEKKPLKETTRITISIEGGPYTDAREGLVASVVNAIMSNSILGYHITELDRSKEAASITLESTGFVYNDKGGYVYEEKAEGFTAGDPATFGGDRADTAGEAPKAERLSYCDAILQAMKPDESKAEPEQADDCYCPACQLHRIIMAGVDIAKAGSDRTETGVYAVTSRGLVRIA